MFGPCSGAPPMHSASKREGQGLTSGQCHCALGRAGPFVSSQRPPWVLRRHYNMTSHPESQAARCPRARPPGGAPWSLTSLPSPSSFSGHPATQVTPPHSSKGAPAQAQEEGPAGQHHPSALGSACHPSGWGVDRVGLQPAQDGDSSQTDKSLFNQSERALGSSAKVTCQGVKSAFGVLAQDAEDEGAGDAATQVSCSPVWKGKDTDTTFSSSNRLASPPSWHGDP